MTNTTVCYEPIGIIRTDYSSVDNLPTQAAESERDIGQIELREEYAAGLNDLNGFSHIVILYHLHRMTEPNSMFTIPSGEDLERGLFATRTPRRPNPIGFSVVRLNEVSGTTLTITGIDMLDRTPLLDLKPFIPEIDKPGECRVGWLEGS